MICGVFSQRIDLAELTDEPWILPPPGTWTYTRMAEAFQERGLDLPKASLVTIADAPPSAVL